MKTASETAMEKVDLLNSAGVPLYKEKAQGVPNFSPSFFYGTFRMGEGQQAGYDDKKPYASHSWVYICAHKIATELKRLPHKIAIRKDTSDDEEHIYKHPALKSFKSPNPWQTRTTFWESIVLALQLPTQRSLGGQVFLIPTSLSGQKVNLHKGEIPAMWYAYGDDWMSPKMEEGIFKSWKWQAPGQTPSGSEAGAIYYEPEELIRIYNFNPYNPLQGLAPYIPVKWSVMQDAEASQFNYHFFKNNCLLTGLLSTEQTITPQQRSEGLKAWNEAYAGSHKAGMTALLGSGLKYQELSQKHLDMQFAEMKAINRDEIVAAYGLNELAFDLGSIPYANVIEGLKMLWHDTYMPIEDHICESITEQWLQYVDPNMALEADYSEVPALKADLEGKVKVASQLITQCQAPIAEAFRLTGIDIDSSKYPWMLEKPQTQAPNAMTLNLGNSNNPPIANKTVEEPKVNPTMDEKHIERNKQIADEFVHKIFMPGEKRFYKMFAKFFSQQRNAVMANVDKWAGKNSKTYNFKVKETAAVPTAGSLLFSVAAENKKLLVEYKPLLEQQMNQVTDALDSELPGGVVNWNVNDETIQAFAALRKEYVEGINSTTFDVAGAKIEDIVADAMDQGLTVSQTAQKIKDTVQELYDIRLTNANTIARTETASITSMTRIEAMKAEGIKYWEWVTAKDDRVRDNHMIDGEIREVGEEFSNGMTMPLDPSADVEDIINCRCVCVYSSKP